MLSGTKESPIRRSAHSIDIKGEDKTNVAISEEITSDISEKVKLLLERQEMIARTTTAIWLVINVKVIMEFA